MNQLLSRPMVLWLVSLSVLGLNCPPSAELAETIVQDDRRATDGTLAGSLSLGADTGETLDSKREGDFAVDSLHKEQEAVPVPPEPLPSTSPDDSEPREESPPTIAPSLPDVPMLAAIAKQVWVLSKPNWKSRKLGYLRAGTVLARKGRPSGYAGCDQGWYRVEPRGYVCVGATATLDVHHPVVEAASKPPDRAQGLPYPYVMSRQPPPPFYVRLPTEEEQARVEAETIRADSTGRKVPHDDFDEIKEEVPAALLYERSAPSLDGIRHAQDTLFLGRPVPRSGFALLHIFDWTGRPFGLTVDMNVIPLDRTRLVEPSRFSGIAFAGDNGLPAAFVRAKGERKFRIDADQRTITDVGAVTFREGFPLTGQTIRVRGQTYLETRDGLYIRDGGQLAVLPPMTRAPGWAQPERKWIDVSIRQQTLVAYEGMRPVYATLVSTGADGLGDPKETHSTVLGAFLIHTKHVTITMDGNEVGDEFDLRDVPYVQYFHEGYALHAAYWHDGFGTARSHGCINVSPTDAAWLFEWTDPQVPKAWHAGLEARRGTLIYIHP